MDYKELIGKIIGAFGTREKFAQYMGWSKAKVTYMLNGERPIGQMDIVRICEALQIKTKDIGSYFFTKKLDKCEGDLWQDKKERKCSQKIT